MRIRKNAKLGSVLPEKPQTLMCQLNRSPWDVFPFGLDLTQLEDREDDSFTGNGNGNGIHDNSVGAIKRRSVASMMDAVDKSLLHIDDVVVDDNDDNNDEGIIASDKAEGKKQTTSSCHQCKNNETNNKQGQSICNEHNNSPSNSSLPSSEKVNDVAVIAHRTRSQVTKKASTAAAASNPYQFYYYSGFGPLWGKRRSKRTEGFNNNKKNEAKGKGGENSTIMEANDVATTNLTSSPSSSSQIDNEGFHYIEAGDFIIEDEDEDEEEEEDDDDDYEKEIGRGGNGESGTKKRTRKPVKARSLKSLM